MNKRLITILAAFAMLTLGGSQIFAHDLATGSAVRQTHAATTQATATQDSDEATTDADKDTDTDEDTDEDDDDDAQD